MTTDYSENGFITLVSVIILLAVATAAALVAYMVAWQSADADYAWLRRDQAASLADACAETARGRLWQDSAYTGSESFEFATGRCAMFPITVASASYEVRAEAVVSGIVARTVAHYELTVDASGSAQTLEAVSFERVADF